MKKGGYGTPNVWNGMLRFLVRWAARKKVNQSPTQSTVSRIALPPPAYQRGPWSFYGAARTYSSSMFFNCLWGPRKSAFVIRFGHDEEIHFSLKRVFMADVRRFKSSTNAPCFVDRRLLLRSPPVGLLVMVYRSHAEPGPHNTHPTSWTAGSLIFVRSRKCHVRSASKSLGTQEEHYYIGFLTWGIPFSLKGVFMVNMIIRVHSKRCMSCRRRHFFRSYQVVRWAT